MGTSVFTAGALRRPVIPVICAVLLILATSLPARALDRKLTLSLTKEILYTLASDNQGEKNQDVAMQIIGISPAVNKVGITREGNILALYLTTTAEEAGTITFPLAFDKMDVYKLAVAKEDVKAIQAILNKVKSRHPSLKVVDYRFDARYAMIDMVIDVTKHLADLKTVEEKRKLDEEKRKIEEAQRLADEARKKEEERRKAEEARRQAELEKKRAEEAKRQAELDKKRTDEERRRFAEEEKRKAAEDARKKAEEDRRRAAEEDKRRLAEEERRKEEAARKKEAARLAALEMDYLLVKKVVKPPLVDGRVEEGAWNDLPYVKLEARGTKGNVEVSVRGVHDGKNIYLAFSWNDPAKDDKHKPWVWNNAKKEYESSPKIEDALAVLLSDKDMPGCMTSGREFQADLWFWRAGRTDPAGYAEDEWLVVSNKKLPQANSYTSAAGGNVWIKTYKDDGEAPYRAEIAVAKGSPEMPRYVPQTPTKSMADVLAKGAWDKGRWTLELSRKLTTGNKDDLALTAGGRRYYFSVSVFNADEGQDHSVTRTVNMTLE